MCEMLKAEIECFNAEVATMEQDLDDAAHDARKERDRLLDRLSTQIAQAVLVGQQHTPIQDAKTLDPILGYVPPHERGQMPIMPPVTTIEWPLESPREENDGAFTGDREASGKRSRLADSMALLTGVAFTAFIACCIVVVGNSISTKMLDRRDFHQLASVAPLLTTTSPRPEQPEAPASIAEKSASERERLDTTRPASLMLVEVPAIEQAPAEIARQQPESAQPTAPDLITRQLDGDEVTSPRPEQPEAPASIAEKSASERERLDTTRPASLMLVEVPAIEQAPAEIARQQPELAQPTAPDLITRQLDGDEVTSLVKRGETFIMSGDLASARLLLQRAAEAGDVHAALALAGTFDPNLLGNGLGADAAMARLWYVRAARLGSAEAAQRLQQLATQVNSVP